jgi:hypothetical protein
LLRQLALGERATDLNFVNRRIAGERPGPMIDRETSTALAVMAGPPLSLSNFLWLCQRITSYTQW